jgi:hypothetical protein
MNYKKKSKSLKVSTKKKINTKKKTSTKKKINTKKKVDTKKVNIKEVGTKKIKKFSQTGSGKGDQKLPVEIIEQILNIRQSKSLVNKDLRKGIEMLEHVYSIYKILILRLQKETLFGYEWKSINEILVKLQQYFYGLAIFNLDGQNRYSISYSIIKTIDSLQKLKNVINILYKNNPNKNKLLTFLTPFVLLPLKIKLQFLEILDKIPDFSRLSKIINTYIERFYDEEQDDFIIPNNFTLPTKDVIYIKDVITKDSDKILKTLEIVIDYYKKPQHKFHLY